MFCNKQPGRRDLFEVVAMQRIGFCVHSDYSEILARKGFQRSSESDLMGQLLDNREDNRYVLGGLAAEVRCILVGAQGCLCFRGPSMGSFSCVFDGFGCVL